MSMDEKQPDENVTIDTPNVSNEVLQGDSGNAPAPTQDTQAAPESPTGQAENAPPKPEEAPRPRRRGFAAMDRDRVKQIASKGGRAAHAAGTAHQFSSDEARVAGKKGGEAPHVRRGGVRRRPVTPTNTTTDEQNRGQGDSR